MECPIKAGETKITKEVELPAQIPPVCSPIPLPDATRSRWIGRRWRLWE